VDVSNGVSVSMNNHLTTIHLGLPKTATTSIRFNLFAKHSQIQYLGKFIGGSFTPPILPVIKKRWSFYERFFTRLGIRTQGVPAQLSYVTEPYLTPVLSMESLAGEPLWKKKLQAEHFRGFFGPCRIILVIREPVTFIKSFYVQMLRNFQEQMPEQRPKWMNSIGEAPHVFKIDQWLQKTWNSSDSPKNYISYADTAQVYANIFGPQNVHIFLFEAFAHNPKMFITELSHLLDISPDESISLLGEKRSNERLTISYINRIHEIEQSEEQSIKFRNSSSKERRNLLNCREMAGDKINPKLSKKWLNKINYLARKQNRQLLENWNIPLSDYEYKI